jgi:methyl coenzyme M reductase subunit C
VHQPNSVIDCRRLTTMGARPALLKRGNLSASSRS